MSDEPFVIAGALDLPRADEVEPALLVHAEQAPGDSVVVDCSEMTFIDSSGLGMLVEVSNQADKRLVLENVSEQCRTVFELTGLENIFELR